MEVTIFLAKLFGFYLVAKSIMVFLRAEEMKKLIAEFRKSRALQMVVGALVLIMGILSVSFHNEWGSIPETLVSLVAWGMVAKGLIFLWAPEESEHLMDDFTDPEWLRIGAVIVYTVGAYLLGVGFGLV